MEIILLIIITLYQLILSIISAKGTKDSKNIVLKEENKIQGYASTIILSLVPVIIIFIFVLLTNITLNDIGFRFIQFNKNYWLTLIVLISTIVITFIMIYQSIRPIVSKKSRQKIRNKMMKKLTKGEHYDEVIMNIIVPITKKEKKWWFFVSLTAGICEEITYRGTMIFLLQNIFQSLNFQTAGIIICILFALAHSYQGVKGIFTTGLVGISFFILYFISNSIFIPMIVHFIVDFSNAFILFEEDENTEIVNNEN